MKPDLNCDLGEGEPRSRTRGLMRWITSANVACGGHAGDVASMCACVRLCKEFGVRLGAHPGTWSRGDFGRNAVDLTPAELELLLLHQVGALERVANEQGVRLHHIKLHGALYHATEANEPLARRYIDTVRRFWPKVTIVARSGGRVVQLARRVGLTAWDEAFVDRAYQNDGTLVPRTEPGAVITQLDTVIRRVIDLKNGRGVLSVSGQTLPVRTQTICIHSDTPSAPMIARTVRKVLQRTRYES